MIILQYIGFALVVLAAILYITSPFWRHKTLSLWVPKRIGMFMVRHGSKFGIKAVPK